LDSRGLWALLVNQDLQASLGLRAQVVKPVDQGNRASQVLLVMLVALDNKVTVGLRVKQGHKAKQVH
jgi:hypothetical protein